MIRTYMPKLEVNPSKLLLADQFLLQFQTTRQINELAVPLQLQGHDNPQLQQPLARTQSKLQRIKQGLQMSTKDSGNNIIQMISNYDQSPPCFALSVCYISQGLNIHKYQSQYSREFWVLQKHVIPIFPLPLLITVKIHLSEQTSIHW